MHKIHIFIGPPGSGKGTQAEFLAKRKKMKIIQPGVLLRQQAANSTKLGQQIKKIMAQGGLVPNHLVDEIIYDKITKARKDIILDGFPRNLPQAKNIYKFISSKKYQVYIIEVKLSEKKVIERIIGRLSCPCGETYHIKFKPPKKTGYCDKCGDKLYVREDATLATVKRRMNVYKKETIPVLRFFKKIKDFKYISIDGEKSIKALNKELLQRIK